MYQTENNILYIDKKNKRKSIIYIENLFILGITILFFAFISYTLTMEFKADLDNAIYIKEHFIPQIEKNYHLFKKITYNLLLTSGYIFSIVLFLFGLNRILTPFKKEENRFKLVICRLERIKNWL